MTSIPGGDATWPAGQPVPYTLTPEALAVLDAAPASDEWACWACGGAWFGTRPEHGRCPDCAARADGWCCARCAAMSRQGRPWQHPGMPEVTP